MFNYIRAKFQNPNKGFDPISKQYAKKYFEDTYRLKGRIDKNLLTLLKKTIDIKGKRVVDLGAGPGQYTLLLAKQGAKVHYHDISHNFVKLAIEKADEEGYSFTHTIDYIDHVKGPYDIIFNRGAFNYCFDDKKFVDILYTQLNHCPAINVLEYGIGGHIIHNFIESYENAKMENFKKVYFFIHLTDFLKDKPYKSKYNKFKETYFRPLYNASYLLKFINKNHKPFTANKKLNKEISQLTKDKTISFLNKAKNISFIYRDDNISKELDFIKDKIQIVNHKRKPHNYGFDLHWNDNGRVNIAEHIINDLAINACQNF